MTVESAIDFRAAKDIRDAGGVNLQEHRPTWAEINLDALATNFHAVRRHVSPEVKILAAVKANAYGHGAIECAKRLSREGVDWFGVALPEEGAALRQAGIKEPVLGLGGFWEGQEGLCLKYGIVPVVYRVDMIAALDRQARAAGVAADIHIKIDTGMGRLGIRWDQAAEFAESLRPFKNIRVDGLMTHFAAADEPERDCFTAEQATRFQAAVGAFVERGYNPTYQDMANSAAIFAHRDTWGQMVRPGGTLYGMWRDVLQASADLPSLRPVMSLRSRIVLLKTVPQGETIGYGCTFKTARETLIATLPIGYNDGYARALSNRGRVIVRGTYAPVVGRISMDLTLIDVTDVPDVSLGDRVTLMGEDEELNINVEDIAKAIGTISYEITCGIGERVPRSYFP